MSTSARWFSGIGAVALLVACQGTDAGSIVDAAGGSSGSGGSDAGFSGSSSGGSGSAGFQQGSGGMAGTPPGAGGVAGSGGTASGGGGSAGAAGSGGSGPPPVTDCEPWPDATSTEEVSSTIEVSGEYDGGMKRLIGVGPLGTGGQDEDQPPFFRLAAGSVLKNVILGGPAADGIHCDGTCWLQNVWWEDVGEDAATLDGTSSSQVMTIECSGARQAADKVFQHNGPGTMVIRDVVAEDFNKFYRSCGNCLTQYTRHVELENITVENGQVLVGLNQNYDDTAEFSNITVNGGITVCQRYTGNDMDLEPSIEGDGPDDEHCLYQESDIN